MRSKSLRRMCKDIARFQERNGWLPEYILEGVAGLELLQDRVYVTGIFERKYPAILKVIRLRDVEHGDGPENDGSPSHDHPGRERPHIGVQLERMFQ